MENAIVTLQGSLSHTVRLPNHNEITFIKGRPIRTSDPAIIAYAKARPVFSVNLLVMPKEVPRSAEGLPRQAAGPPPMPSQRTGAGRFIRKSPVSKPAETDAEGSGD